MTAPTEYCLAIDQGTFSSRALVFDQQGVLIRSAQQPVTLNRIDQHRVEQDADEILASIQQVIRQSLIINHTLDSNIKSMGLATQRSSIVAWKKSSGQALSPILSWQDTRAHQDLSSFNQHLPLIESTTGLRLSPHYGVSKIRWLIKNNRPVQQAIKDNDCIISPIASYLLFHITRQKHILIDAANASRMLLLNIQTQDWDQNLLDLFQINTDILPHCKKISSNFGTLKNTDIRINAVNGDQNAALYQSGQPEQSAFRINLGTGAFVLTPIEQQLLQTELFQQSGLLAGVSNSTDDTSQIYMEGTVNGAASALAWMEKNFPYIRYREVIKQADLSQLKPPVFLNTIGGLGSPIWRSALKPYFLDFEPSENNTDETVLAVLESIVFLLMINIERMLEIKPGICFINISGGLSNISVLCQSLADLTQLEVHQSEDTEATARGIAWLSCNNYKKMTPQWPTTHQGQFWDPKVNLPLKSRYEKFKSLLFAA